MDDLWYLALAYGVIWLGLVGYVVRLAVRAESLGREVNLLKRILRGEDDTAEEGQSETIASSVTRPGRAGSEA